jgi:hypothetical protein
MNHHRANGDQSEEQTGTPYKSWGTVGNRSRELSNRDNAVLNTILGMEDGEHLNTTISIERDGMTSHRMLAYSLGHFSNDLFASMWFIYQSYYYLNVL